MATREEQSEAYKQVLQNIEDGDSFAAYGAFQKLPFMDQMGLYMQPGVGDAIAYVESAVEMDKGKENFKEGNYAESAGNYLTGGIAAASMIPFVGSAVDAARVGGKTIERGIGGLMNKVRSRMDDDIPGGGSGPKQGSLFKEGNQLIGDFFKQNKLPNVFNRKQMPGTFANTKSINMGDGLQTNVMSSNGVSAGAKVDNILNDLADSGIDGITFNQSYTKPLVMIGRRDGASYEIQTKPGENGIELSISKIYSKAPTEADVLAEKSLRKLEGEQTNIPKVREMIKKEKNLVAVDNKKQILNRLEAERSQEAQFMTAKSLSNLDNRIGKIKAEIVNLSN
mgnify:CR=1 FL=1